MASTLINIAPEVRDALADGRAVVALETSVVAHGLPRPSNLETAARMSAAVRGAGAVPAFAAVIGGRIVLGADEAQLERLADGKAAKAGSRDLAALIAGAGDAGTTVSATCAIAALCGVRVFATGGIGGVHRGGFDVSSDLLEISRQPVCVVSAGPKVILDVPATAEALESLGIPVVGWKTSVLPAFYVSESVVKLEHRVESAEAMATLLAAHWHELRRDSGVLLAVPPPSPLAAAEIEAALGRALSDAAQRGISGKAITPFLLAALASATDNRALAANVALLEQNGSVGGLVAVALAGRARS